MNIAEIIKQARVLSVQERRELVNLLNDSIAEEAHLPERSSPETSREVVRAKLMAAGKLSQTNNTPHRVVDEPPFILPAGARSSEDILNEDRAER
jgi:hypothetical protein